MRVAFVITELHVGGAERCLTELALGLADRGDEVRVFSLGGLPFGQHRMLVDRLNSAGIAVVSGNAHSSVDSYGAYRRLRSWMDDFEPEICQTFLYHANVLGTFAAVASGIEIRLAGLRIAEKKPLRCRIERSALKRATGVVCVSEGVKQFARQNLDCSGEKSVVIPNGVDVSRFASADPMPWSTIGWPDDSIVSLFVGRLHRQKGIELLQEEIDCIAPSGSNKRLLMVGDGLLRSELQTWVNSVGEDRVKLQPWQNDITAVMRACRMLLLPSHYEGMPNVVLEAMAAGRPVVCSRVEGSQELLADTLDQQSFPAGDGMAMKRLVDRFYADESLCDEIGHDNQSRVRRDFSVDAMVAAYRSHYQALLTQKLHTV